MTPGRVERKLAAILAADVAGYSRLMGADEEGTLSRLKAHRRELIDPKLAEHRGRVVKTSGDGILIEFPSVVDAVRCATEIQSGMAERNRDVPEGTRIEFRVGINLGDVIIDGDDIHGDGVNIAARLENLSEPGGICVSRKVREEIGEKATVSFEDMGEQILKNIASPVRVYRVEQGAQPKARPVLALPDKPSIAVLPFQNMSGDPEQEYFADGMVEEIITALSRFRQLFVIARNSSFTYKGRAVDVKQVGRELGVRYVLEGSVRKAGNRVRITGELIDASTAAQLWSDRIEGGLEDIFDLQDMVTANVVGALAPKLESAEIERAMRKPTESLNAYDYYLRGMRLFNEWRRPAGTEALSLFYRAIELDPEFASAYGMAARCYAQRKAGGWVTDRDREVREATRLARRAADLGREDSLALGTAGFALAWVVGELEEGAALVERALALNPNFAWGWGFSGWINVWLGKPELAVEHLGRALRLSPYDPLSLSYQAASACAYFFNERYDEAWSRAEIGMRDRPEYAFPNFIGAASGALSGRQAEAEKAAGRLRSLMPDLRISNLSEFFPLRRAQDVQNLADGLRKAGLPE